MKTIEELLRSLARPEVLEFALASDRLPCVKVGSTFQPVDGAAPTTDAILQMLAGVGGGRHVDALTPKPTQWTARVDGLGIVTVSAIMRNDVVQARFTLTKREQGAAFSATMKDTVPGTPSAKHEIALPKRDPRREQTDPPPRPPAHRDDDEPTLTTAHPGMPERRPPESLEIEIDDPHPSSRRAKAAPPRPPSPVLDDEDKTAETDLPPQSAPAPAPVAARQGAPSPKSPQGGTPAAAPVISVDTRPAAFAPGAARPGAAPPDLKDTVRSASKVAEQLGLRKPAATAPGTVLDELLAMARSGNASDLHVIAGRPALVRVGGELVPRTGAIDPAAVQRIVEDVVPERLRSVLEADGSCDFALDHGAHGRFRVNVSRQRTGFKVCLRLVPRDIPTLAGLGLPESIAAATEHHQGLILVTGPSGHGKTNTLAALVNTINRDTTHHVITVEDPIEFLHPRKKALLSQREVGTHTRSFGAALKAALREDPDVVVIGELRDTETVRAALSASETGHLVIGTMNTPSAAKTIDRVIDLFPPAEQQQVRMTLAGALRLIVSQRLVPNGDRTRMHAAAEILPSSISLYTLIRDAKTFQIPSLQQRGRGQGIARLDDSLAALVWAGKVEIGAARQFAEAPEDFDQLIAQRAPQQTSGAQAQAPQPAGAAAKKRTPEEQAMDLGGLLSKAGSLFGGKKV